MFEQDKQLTALRASYKKNLLANLGISLTSVVAGLLLLGLEFMIFSIEGGIALGLSVALAALEYAVERVLYKKGKNPSFLLTVFVLGLMVIFVVLWKLGIPWAATLFLPMTLGMMLVRPLIPAVGLLRDYGRLKEGDLCETVGRMKSGSHRMTALAGRETYLLFEDELTHETHLLRAGSLSPTRRYRIFYLPHSGLAVGEEIPDDVTFDPFGNPTRREVSEETVEEAFSYAAQGSYTEKPEYNEDGGYAAKPDDTDESDTAGVSHDETYAPTGGTPYRDSRYDPNSPERQKAAKYATAAKVCKVLTFLCFGIVFVGAISAKVTDTSPLLIFFFIPLIVVALLNSHFKHQELKLRCTERAIAVCIDTVRRRSGKHSHLHPIVEYEAEGVRHTAELSVTCTRGAVGETYTIYYDPLEPDTVRVG